MELNEIKKQGKWTDISDTLNENFAKVNAETQRLELASRKNKGYYATYDELASIVPQGSMGDIAFVGSNYPYHIYKWNGTEWIDTFETGGAQNVNLADYYTRTDVDNLIKLEEQEREQAYQELDKTLTSRLDVEGTGLMTVDEMINFNPIANEGGSYLVGYLDKPSRYVVTKEVGGVPVNVGILEILSDSSQHVYTQVFTTHFTLDNSGNLELGAHSDTKLVTYFRSFSIDSPLIDSGTWTKWEDISHYSDILESIAKNTEEVRELGTQVIYDVSANNGEAIFASLSELLSSENLSTLIPTAVRCGGMSIRFVQSSDNKYVQFRCMAQNFTTDVNQWQGVDGEPTAGSKNLVESGGVAKVIPSDSISDNYIINKYIKTLWISGNVALSNVKKVAISFNNSRLVISLKDSESNNLYSYSHGSEQIYPGTFIDTTTGYCLLKEQSSYRYLFAQIDFTGIGTLSERVLTVNFNEKLVTNIQYASQMLQWASSFGLASFEVVEFEIQETSKRISIDGTIANANSNWGYTKPISVNKGDMIYVKTDGNAAASVMSKYDNGSYTNLISYNSNANNSYYYVCKESMNVAFSLFQSQYCCIFRYQNNLSTQILDTGIKVDSAYDIWVEQGNTGTEQDFLNSLKGQDGQDGKSAYEIAVEEGYVGTEEQWLNSLVGQQGERGAQGLQGNSGYSGAAGELEVVNNLTDGGATSALSAEMGKSLGNLTDYNAIPVIPNIKNPCPIASAPIDVSAWTSDVEGQIVGIKEVYDFVHRKYVKSIETKILTTAPSNSNKIYASLTNAVNINGKCVRYSLHIDENIDLTKLLQIKLILGSGGISSGTRCTSVIWTKDGDESHTFGGIVAGCINPVLLKESSGSSFNASSVDMIGFHLIYSTPVTSEMEIDVIQLDVVNGLSKPGVVLVVDNFESPVVDMAEYAAAKGVRLNLSVIPNWIGGASASLEEIQRIKKLGHLIFNHTWNHNTGQESYAEVSEGIFKADNWMIRNGMARGSKFVSNPSAFYNNTRFKAQMDSEALVVYHNWTPYPNGESGNGRYLITFPYYPAERFLNISGLDWNSFTPERLSYFKTLAETAITNHGIAVIGFHDAAWDVDNGVSWKAFIDYVAEIQGIYFYGIDEIVEGLYC